MYKLLTVEHCSSDQMAAEMVVMIKFLLLYLMMLMLLPFMANLSLALLLLLLLSNLLFLIFAKVGATPDVYAPAPAAVNACAIIVIFG